MIDSGLPESFILQNFNHQASCMGIWDGSSEELYEEDNVADDEDVFPELFDCNPIFINNKDIDFAYLFESLP